ncbi:MAG: DUF4912 domain-containing protein [Pseudanabaenaceae cyanobacterium]
MARERPPLEEMTLRQLRKVAAELDISRYSRMRKDQLLEAIKLAQSKAPQSQPTTPSTMETTMQTQEIVEATKFDVGGETLATADSGLGGLPQGYGISRIVLMPRDPQWAYAYWDVPNDHKQSLRNQGGQTLALRLYDAENPAAMQEYNCDEFAREWWLPIPISDRSYFVEIGYRCADGRWLMLCRSSAVHIPPLFPSDWVEDHFITVPWEQSLKGQKFAELIPPARKLSVSEIAGTTAAYDEIFNTARGGEAQRVAGSVFGSMHMAAQPSETLSSYIFPSGIGMVPGSLMTMSGVGMVSSLGVTGFSGAGLMALTASGIGMFSASAAPIRPRQFWLVADAELIVYGATEPDATVTIAGRPIKLNADGTFRHHMSFQDGIIDYPILAVAADGVQTRAIHMRFERQTLERRTNTKEEAIPEWIVG